MASGGGGGGDYAAQAAEENRKRAAAMAEINAIFGIAPKPAAEIKPPVAYRPDSPFAKAFERMNLPAIQAAERSNRLTPIAEKNRLAREALYEKTRTDTLGLLQADIDEQELAARRGTKFNLARRGLTGGSADVDLFAELGRKRDDAVRKAVNAAEGAATGFRASDEQARMNIIGQIASGLDAATAAENARRSMDASAAAASGASKGAAIAGAFGGVGDIWASAREADEISRAQALYGGMRRRASPGVPNPVDEYVGRG